jgi:MurNAc alpha-1-phosphate uridylyltransferase
MVAAAGIGTRMRPLTDIHPKALVTVAGKTLLDHQLDRLKQAGVKKAVVNIHHFADQMQQHLTARTTAPKIHISDERDLLLETGGGLMLAAKHLGNNPFFVMNVDTLWQEHENALLDLAAKKHQTPDALAVLLLARRDNSLGLNTAGDFHMHADGQLQRRKNGEASDYYYAGIQIFDPKLLKGFSLEKFSTNLFWDKALQQKRLYGIELQGLWMHVGDPQSLLLAEQAIKVRKNGQ